MPSGATTPRGRRTAQLVNAWVVWASSLQNTVATPALSPYDNPLAASVLQDFRALLERHVARDGAVDRAAAPLLLVGAVDVLSGEFRAFTQPARGDLRRHGARVRRDSDALPRRPCRERHVLGRPLLPEPADPRALGCPARRAPGHPDQPQRARARAADGGRDRRPPQ